MVETKDNENNPKQQQKESIFHKSIQNQWPHSLYTESHNFIIKHNIQDSKQSIIIKINGTD